MLTGGDVTSGARDTNYPYCHHLATPCATLVRYSRRVPVTTSLRPLGKRLHGRLKAMDSERRRQRRRSVDWAGRFWFNDDPGAEMGACRVIDVSELGAGVELFGEMPLDLIGRLLAVRVPGPAGGSMGFHIAGIVRHVAPGRSGGVRLGIEFD